MRREPQKARSRSGSSSGQVAAPPCGKSSRLPGVRLQGLSPPPGDSSASSRPPAAQKTGVWPRGCVVGAPPRLTCRVGVRPGGRHGKGRGPSAHLAASQSPGTESQIKAVSLLALRFPLGAAGKAVNTVASGDRSRKYLAVFFPCCLPNQARSGLQESSSRRYNTLDSMSHVVRLSPVTPP